MTATSNTSSWSCNTIISTYKCWYITGILFIISVALVIALFNVPSTSSQIHVDKRNHKKKNIIRDNISSNTAVPIEAFHRLEQVPCNATCDCLEYADLIGNYNDCIGCGLDGFCQVTRICGLGFFCVDQESPLSPEACRTAGNLHYCLDDADCLDSCTRCFPTNVTTPFNTTLSYCRLWTECDGLCDNNFCCLAPPTPLPPVPTPVPAPTPIVPQPPALLTPCNTSCDCNQGVVIGIETPCRSCIDNQCQITNLCGFNTVCTVGQ